MYNAKDHNIACSVYDSPFCSLMKLAREIAIDKTGLPKFIVTGALQIIKQTIQTKAKFQITDLDVIKRAERCVTPCIFVASKLDTFTRCHHSEKLHSAYKGADTRIIYFEGEHNESRPTNTTNAILEFISAHLRGGGKSATGSARPSVQPLQQPLHWNLGEDQPYSPYQSSTGANSQAQFGDGG